MNDKTYPWKHSCGGKRCAAVRARLVSGVHNGTICQTQGVFFSLHGGHTSNHQRRVEFEHAHATGPVARRRCELDDVTGGAMLHAVMFRDTVQFPNTFASPNNATTILWCPSNLAGLLSGTHTTTVSASHGDNPQHDRDHAHLYAALPSSVGRGTCRNKQSLPNGQSAIAISNVRHGRFS
jgi:hypothetical protein